MRSMAESRSRRHQHGRRNRCGRVPSDGHVHRQAGSGRDAAGRRDHGRGRCRAGQGGRGRRGGGRHGPRAGPGRHPARRRRGPDERSGADRGDQGRGDRPGHGQGPDRPLRRGPGPEPPSGSTTSTRARSSPRPTRPTTSTSGPSSAVRVRRHQPGRGLAPDLRGRGHDPLQGRGGHRQHRRGRPPPAVHPRGHPAGSPRPTRPSSTAGPRSWPRPIGLVQEIAATGRLPVPLFCAGGIATPADASLVMQLGAEAVFVGSGIFKSGEPGADGPGRRRGDRPLRRRRPGGQGLHRVWARPWPARRSARSACTWPSVAGEPTAGRAERRLAGDGRGAGPPG